VEGVARSLDPRLNIWQAAEPVVRDWMTQELGPAGTARKAQDSLSALVRAALQAPELADRVDRLTRDLENVLENGIPLAKQSTAALGRQAGARSLIRDAALWIGAISLAAIAIGLW
ncbi:MAG: ubiquinone biosynthesis protein UbiB, partial [Pseudomonadota bacterium]